MGGGCCVLFACQYPERVSALVLADTLIGIELPESVHSEMDRVQRDTANLSQTERVLGVTTRDTSPAMVALYSQIASFNSVGLRTLTGTQRVRSLDDLAATHLPVLFVVGSEDILFPPKVVEAIQRRLPASQLHVIPDVGHSAHFESPQAFNDILATWLTSLPIDA
jgi:pimeloyl-ACP methyl ester carboxylesterase